MTCPIPRRYGSSGCYPRAQYKPAARVVTVPRPVAGGRIGGEALRDTELLEWCTALLDAVS